MKKNQKKPLVNDKTSTNFIGIQGLQTHLQNPSLSIAESKPTKQKPIHPISKDSIYVSQSIDLTANLNSLRTRLYQIDAKLPDKSEIQKAYKRFNRVQLIDSYIPNIHGEGSHRYSQKHTKIHVNGKDHKNKSKQNTTKNLKEGYQKRHRKRPARSLQSYSKMVKNIQQKKTKKHTSVQNLIIRLQKRCQKQQKIHPVPEVQQKIKQQAGIIQKQSNNFASNKQDQGFIVREHHSFVKQTQEADEKEEKQFYQEQNTQKDVIFQRENMMFQPGDDESVSYEFSIQKYSSEESWQKQSKHVQLTKMVNVPEVPEVGIYKWSGEDIEEKINDCFYQSQIEDQNDGFFQSQEDSLFERKRLSDRNFFYKTND